MLLRGWSPAVRLIEQGRTLTTRVRSKVKHLIPSCVCLLFAYLLSSCMDWPLDDAGDDAGRSDVQEEHGHRRLAIGRANCDSFYDPDRPLTFDRRNDNFVMQCCGCRPEDEPVIDETFRAQTIAFDCLRDYLHYTPGRWQDSTPMTTYLLFNMDSPVSEARFDFRITQGVLIFMQGFIGTVSAGNTHVSRIMDVLMDLHETTHVFTDLALDMTPAWFSEGFSEQTEGRLDCAYPRTFADRYWMAKGSLDWIHVQHNEPLESGFPLESHTQGAIFFAALHDSYGGCHLDCAQRIWNELRRSFESGSPVTTALIRTVSERIVGHDLGYLFTTARLSDIYRETGPIPYP